MADMDQILDIFRQEASENLAALEKGFLDLETADTVEARSSIINKLFRDAHSLKGAARAVELFDIQSCAQSLEDTLSDLRDDPETATGEAVTHGIAQFDKLRLAYEKWQHPASAAAPAETVALSAPVVDPADDTFTVRVNSDRLDRMLSLAGELRISQRAADMHAQQLTTFRQQLNELPIPDLRIAAEIEQKVRSAIGNWQSAMLDQLKRIEAAIHNKHVREELLLESLESDIREARLLPLSMLTDSLRRPVRDLAQSLGKSIRYEVDVGTVLLDKAVIEALKAPLLHMIRNAADHGIETPQERHQSGKPEEGHIMLRARQYGDRVHIEVSDDGRGVDFARIREHLQQSGQLEDAEIDALSERELTSYLFRAGFSTATGADEISGRGVGLDVVYESTHRLHGSVELHDSSPAGTTFTIAVPVTISTIRILTVTCGGEYYGIPSSSVVRTARVPAKDLRELEGQPILTIDGEPVPWVMLQDLLRSPSTMSDGNGRAIPYVLTSVDGRRLAIGVDDTEDELEVILKPLGYPLTGMTGIVGGTIRPDGSVQIVLDPANIAFRFQGTTGRLVSASPPKTVARILVVDDSPTTRTIVRNVLATAGYSVRTATDGVDALERLQHQPVDLVVTDIQMPRMNGFELTRQVKSQFGLPVVLVTALEKEEHRREGLAAGADAYVVKSSFEGEGLLEIVNQFV